MRLAAILLAGGAGTRLGHPENKVFLPVAGQPLLGWSLRAFDRSPLIDDIVLVVREADRRHVDEVLARQPTSKLRTTVAGGASRHDSEDAGLAALVGDIAEGRTDYVLIHDAARPFVSQDLLARVVRTAREVGGAIPGLDVEHPVYRLGDGGLLESLSSVSFRRVQTPQAFRAAPLLDAYRAAKRDGFQAIDTSQTIERYGRLNVAVVPGDPRNIKVTFADDLSAVEQLAAVWPGCERSG